MHEGESLASRMGFIDGADEVENDLILLGDGRRPSSGDEDVFSSPESADMLAWSSLVWECAGAVC
jgi:hypothetical protein